MKSIELFLLSGTQCPGLTAIQESTHDAGSVDLDLCVHGQLVVVPCFLFSLVIMVAALPMRLLSSASSERVSEIAEPR